MTWHNMDNAPKDGTRVLLECSAHGGTRIIEASFVANDFDKTQKWKAWCGKKSITSTEYLEPLRWTDLPT